MKEEIEKIVLSDERLSQYISDKEIKRIIVIPGRIANVVVG